MDREALTNLLAQPNLRSADRANIATMLKKVQKGGDLTYQERQNLWAYCNRYGVQIYNVHRR